MNILLKNRNFALLWSGQSVSSLGTWINFVGLNAYIYHLTGSGKILGTFFLIRILPALFFGSLGGILADRYDKRIIMILCDAVRAVTVLAFVVTDNLAAFFIIGFILSSLDKIYLAASGALVPDIVKKDDILASNSLSRMSYSVITVFGPAIGGVLIGFWGYKAVFVIDSATFFFSVATLLLISHGARRTGEAKEQVKTSVADELRDTFRFLAGSTVLLTFTLLRVLDGLGSGSYNTIMPVFAASVPMGQGSFYGYLIAFWGGGTFLGSLLVTYLRKNTAIRTDNLFCGATILMACGMGGTFLTGEKAISLLSITIGGIGDGISSVLFNTLLMELPPKELRGKIFGSISSLFYVVAGTGMFLAGLCLDYVKYVHITTAGSLLIIAGTLVVWWILMATRRKEHKTPQ
ncbi:MAG: MFS transporter [Candidatus Eremiobacteraeota bacterium]|nr:MFS transporter [Candidatus Eremiobacteraeota bacterium]